MKAVLRALLLTPVLAGLAAVAVPGVAGASAGAVPAATKQIASCRAHGTAPHCQTNGKHPKIVVRPVSIHVHFSTVPSGEIIGAWAVSCTKGSKTKIKSKSVKGTGPLTRKVKFPMSHPDTCFVIANGALIATGKIHVWVTART